MKNNLKIAALVAVALISSSAFAEETITINQGPAKVSAGVGAGIFGFNANVGYRFADTNFLARRSGIRLDLNYVDITADDVDIGDQDLDVTYKGQAIGLLYDFYPFTGFWRITGGAYVSDFKINGVISNFTGSVEIGDHNYDFSIKDEVHASIKWGNGFMPYAGTGFDLRLIAGLRLSLDIGVMFHNGFDFGYKIKGETWDKLMNGDLTHWNGQDLDDVRDDIKDQLDKIKDDFEKVNDTFKVWPQVKVGLAYQF